MKQANDLLLRPMDYLDPVVSVTNSQFQCSCVLLFRPFYICPKGCLITRTALYNKCLCVNCCLPKH